MRSCDAIFGLMLGITKDRTEPAGIKEGIELAHRRSSASGVPWLSSF